jgi:histone-lysine N-methyltransferase SETMAR
MQLGGHTDFVCPFIWSCVSGLMRFLTADQKQQRVNVCEELCQIASDGVVFVSMVIAGNESWIYSYDPETKQQTSQWKMMSKVKSMLTNFFDIKGIVHKAFVLAGQTVRSTYYCDCVKLCKDFVLWRQNNLLLHYNNALSQTSFFTREFFTKTTRLLSSIHHTRLT